MLSEESMAFFSWELGGNVELGIGGGERERRGWFKQMFCGARTVKAVPYSAIYYALRT